ncbi:hypothetical protein T02_15956 [Trichinella nativa]|uniref:Uncharacterized protein n=1 Tax=Trichinella nativa TaxID=6335 RepID=A0A0V1L0B0_9BILA|nr:hypothetical protein T02_15956 [Trichinella nativa]
MKKANSPFTKSKWVPLLWKNYLEENHSKRCDAIGAVAPISCLVGEAAKPSPPEAAAEHAFSFSGRRFYQWRGKTERDGENERANQEARLKYFSKEHPICLQLNILYLAGIGFFVVNIRKSTAAACIVTRIVAHFLISHLVEPFSERQFFIFLHKLVCFVVVNGHENDHSGGICYVDTCKSVWLSFQYFKSNLRFQTLRRTLNEFIIFVVDRVILAGFHFELLKVAYQ